MKNSYLLLLIPLAVLFILSGCIQPTWCGDGSCNGNEDSYNCPQDCGYPEKTVILTVQVMDSTGSLGLHAYVSVTRIKEGIPVSGWGGETDQNGKILFEVPQYSDFDVTASADGYNSQTKSISTVNSAADLLLELEPTGDNLLPKIQDDTLYYLDAGIETQIPLIVEVSLGKNFVIVRGEPIIIDINLDLNYVDIWYNETDPTTPADVSVPLIGTENVRTLGASPVILSFWAVPAKYVFYYEISSNRGYFLLSEGEWGDLETHKVAFEGTHDANLENQIQQFYLPDRTSHDFISTFLGMTEHLNEGDLLKFYAKFVKDKGTTEEKVIVVDTSTGNQTN